MLPTSERIGEQVLELGHGLGAKRVLDAHALGHGDKIDSRGSRSFCPPRRFIHAVIKYDVNEVFRILAHDRWQTAEIHQQRSVAVERNHSSLRQPERHSQRDGRSQPQRPAAQIPIARAVCIPLG